MPRINIPQSSVLPDTQNIGHINSMALADSGQHLSEVARQLEAINQRFKSVRDFRNESLETIGLKEDFIDISNRASNDPNPNNLHTYIEEVDKVLSKRIDNIVDPVLRMQVSNKFTTSALGVKSDLTIDANAKTLKQAEGSFYKVMADFAEDARSASEDRLQENSLMAEDLINNAEKNGVITVKEANSFRTSYKEVWNKNRKDQTEQDFYAVLDKDPLSALYMAQSEEFKSVVGVEKANQLEEASRKRFDDVSDNIRKDKMMSYLNADKQLSDMFTSGSQDLLENLFTMEQDLLMEGSPEALERVEVIRSMRDSFIKKNYPSPDAQAGSYNDFVDRLDMAKKKGIDMKDFLNLQTEIMKAGFSGQIDKEQYKHLMKYAGQDLRDDHILNKGDGKWGFIPAGLVPGEGTYDRGVKIVDKYLKENNLQDRTEVKANHLRNMFRLLEQSKVEEIKDINERKSMVEQAVAASLGYKKGEIYTEEGVTFKFLGFTKDGSIDVEEIK